MKHYITKTCNICVCRECLVPACFEYYRRTPTFVLFSELAPPHECPSAYATNLVASNDFRGRFARCHHCLLVVPALPLRNILMVFSLHYFDEEDSNCLGITFVATSTVWSANLRYKTILPFCSRPNFLARLLKKIFDCRID